MHSFVTQETGTVINIPVSHHAKHFDGRRLPERFENSDAFEGAQGKSSRTPPPPEAQNKCISTTFLEYFVSVIGKSFLGRALVDRLPYTIALTKRLDKQANIARARYVKMIFGLLRYANPCVNARWSM